MHNSTKYIGTLQFKQLCKIVEHVQIALPVFTFNSILIIILLVCRLDLCVVVLKFSTVIPIILENFTR